MLPCLVKTMTGRPIFVILVGGFMVLCAAMRIEFRWPNHNLGCGQLICWSEIEKKNRTIPDIFNMTLAIILLLGNRRKDLTTIKPDPHPKIVRQIPRSKPCPYAVFACEMTYRASDGTVQTASVMDLSHLANDRRLDMFILGMMENIRNRTDYFVQLSQTAQRVTATIPLQDNQYMFWNMRKVIKPVGCIQGMPSYSARTIVSIDDEDFLCDTETDGGGWIVFQRRSVGGVDFDRDWLDYKYGFGSITGDFWRGNQAIRELTRKNYYEFRIDTWFDGRLYYAHYRNFAIRPEDEQYKLWLGPFLDGYGDAMLIDGSTVFSTRDRDNDPNEHRNCADGLTGGWWYTRICALFYPNGVWGRQHWLNLTHVFRSLDAVELKLRRITPKRTYDNGNLNVSTDWDPDITGHSA